MSSFSQHHHHRAVFLLVLGILLMLATIATAGRTSQKYTLFTLKKQQHPSTTQYKQLSSSYMAVRGHLATIAHEQDVSIVRQHHPIEAYEATPVAWVSFDNTIEQNGWSTLQIKTSDMFDNEQQAFAAGYLEGLASAQLIGPYWMAFKEYSFNNTLKPRFDAFMTEQLQYMERNVFNTKHTDPDQRQFWNQVGLIITQVRGMKAGYSEAVAQNSKLNEMSFLDFWKFQFDGDLSDIEQKLSPADFSAMNKKEISVFAMIHSKCSALIKYTKDRRDLLVTHSTWDTYANQLRVYKHMELNFKNEGVLPVNQASNLISFSSSPAWIVSVDDFYITSSGLIVTETTNNVFNNDLYKYVTPQTVPFFVRNAIANRLAKNAPQWTKYFSMENSGTYNNQWMIIDTNKFVPGAARSDPDLFHILEQVPGQITAGSASSYLDETGYWASYNIPFYPNIYNISGYPQMAKEHGDEWTHDHCPRANIFRAYQNQVDDIESLKLLIRRNTWATDTYSLGNACNQIAARCDLNKPYAGSHYRAFGQIDAKLTSIGSARTMKSVAQNGPTFGGVGKNPPFSWSKSSFAKSVAHVLQPDTFDFDYVSMQPKSPFPEA